MSHVRAAPELSVIVPTFNEAGNVRLVVEAIDAVLKNITWEVVFVDDDSTDATTLALRELALKDARVRLLHRVGRRGLSSAVVEGILSTSSPYVAVMDADLQHDEAILPMMFEALKSGRADVVVGSRYATGGSIGQWERRRAVVSRVANWLAKLLVRNELTDPMSGYFAVTRVTFESAMRRLSSQGYKILLDLFASLPDRPRLLEIPYTFRTRHSGTSKLDAMVAWEYGMLLLDKIFGHLIPIRFFMFALVGSIGVIVHFLGLWALYRVGGVDFGPAQTLATVVTMTFNFFLNNVFTYRDRRMEGWSMVLGLLSFYAACSIGVLVNVGVSSFIFGQQYRWWIAGGAGAMVSAVWNYAATSVFTWRRKR